MTITDFNYESSYLPSLTCNMDVRVILTDQLAYLPPIEACSGQEWQFKIAIVKANIGRSTDWSTLLQCNASRDVYYGMYLPAILDSSRKGGNLLLFLNNEGSNQSVCIVESCQINPPWHPQCLPNTPKHCKNTPKSQLQISTMRAHIYWV